MPNHEPGESAAPKRIQRKRTKGWKMPPNTEYVGRPTMFGNPYKVTALTDMASGQTEYCVEADASFHRFASRTDAAKGAVSLFRGLATADINSAESWRRKVAFALRGKDLACWCPLVDKDGNPVPCHADILLEIANAKS